MTSYWVKMGTNAKWRRKLFNFLELMKVKAQHTKIYDIMKATLQGKCTAWSAKIKWLQRARQHLRDTLGDLENQEQTTPKRIDKKRESKSGVKLSEKTANKRMNGMKSWFWQDWQDQQTFWLHWKRKERGREGEVWEERREGGRSEFSKSEIKAEAIQKLLRKFRDS